MELISYKYMFELLDIKDILFFEDDFRFEDTKNAIVYSIWRQNKNDRKHMMKELKTLNPLLYSKLKDLIYGFDLIKEITDEQLNQIIINEIESAFDLFPNEFCDFKKKYDVINVDNDILDPDTQSLLHFYGIGVVEPEIFGEIFRNYISSDQERKSFRVFRSFNALEQKQLDNYIKNSNGFPVVGIIDNQLMSEQRGEEIVQVFKNHSKATLIGAIFSSTTDIAIIDEKVYLEIVNKEDPSKLNVAIVKSAYSYVLRKLHRIYKKTLDDAFKDAVQNRNIAYYLSSMARIEGISNYQVITEWIRLLFNSKLSDEPSIKEIIRLSKLLSMLEDDGEITEEFSKLNSYEVFDLNVNKFYEPIAAGDVFEDNDGKLYILVGQDCEMMFNANRPEKNGVAELVEAEVGKQSDPINDIKQNRENICINNFRKADSEGVSKLVIKYTSRKFIENQILRLCQFNDTGECGIYIDKDLEDVSRIMPEYYFDLHKGLNGYFSALVEINNKCHEELHAVFENKHSPRLKNLNITDFIYDDSTNKLSYPLTRIGRLREPYTMFLYKLYLEHRGRLAFNTINMSRIQPYMVKVEDTSESIDVDLYLSTSRDDNKNDIRKLTWILSKKDVELNINRIFEKQDEREEWTICSADESIILDNNSNPYDKEICVSGNRKMKLTKRKKSLKIEMI